MNRRFMRFFFFLALLVSGPSQSWDQDQDTRAENPLYEEQKTDSTPCLALGYEYEERTSFIVFAHLQKALEPYDVCITGQPLPLKRHMVLMRDGVIDGDVARVWGLHKGLPGVIRVPTPHSQFKRLLVARKGAMSSLDDFEKIRLGLTTGALPPDGSILFSSYETKDRLYRTPAQSVTVPYVKDLPNLLDRGRVDAILMWEIQAQNLLNLDDYDSFEIFVTGIYTYLTTAQAAYVPVFDEAIKSYKAAGKSFNDPLPDTP